MRERRYALGLLDGIGPIEEARAALADARAEADRLAPLVADLEREVGPLRDAARSPRGGLLFGVAAHAWLTPPGRR